MNKTKDSLLVVNENSVFYKIKNFFRKLFFKNRNEKIIEDTIIPNSTLDNNIDKKNSIVENIKIKENKEIKELLYLQKLFKMGRIKEKDLSKKERIGLEKLYKHQIYELNKSINSYKNKIISVRKKLVQSN